MAVHQRLNLFKFRPPCVRDLVEIGAKIMGGKPDEGEMRPKLAMT